MLKIQERVGEICKNMNYEKEKEKFVEDGYKRVCAKPETERERDFLLKDRRKNFFKLRHKFKFHRWAHNLKSSQAFAYNIFGGIDNAKFEFGMWALDDDPLHKACMDVAIEKNGVVDMYEVKMFEFTRTVGANPIFHKHRKYFCPVNYKWNKQVVKPFISFIEKVEAYFKNQRIHGEGIKQLCCHLLGIINEMTIPKGELVGKTKVILYSLCFDPPFSSKFMEDVENYRNTLEKFKQLVDEFLKEINHKLNIQIEYHGFLSAREYIEEKEELLGKENCDYVKDRYFYNQ